MFNDGKTEFMILSSRFSPSVTFSDIHIGDEFVSTSDIARNLGFIFDSGMSLTPQVNNTVKTSFGEIRKLSMIRKSLTEEATKTVVHAFVTTRLDYCNSLYFRLPDCQIRKLQNVQNSAARIISGAWKYDHITPVFKELHWLPVYLRIQYKIILLTYKSLNGLGLT